MWVPGKPVREYSTLFSKIWEGFESILTKKIPNVLRYIISVIFGKRKKRVFFVNPGCKSVAVLGNFLKT